MADSPSGQIKENNRKNIQELNLIEELEEHAFSDIHETEDIITYLVERGGLDREAVKDLIEEEEEEVELESRSVELEEEVLMRFKENLKILGGLIEMILDQERNTEKEMDHLSQQVKQREPGYSEEFKEEVLNVLERIREEMESEFEQLKRLLEEERDVISCLQYAFEETEMAEHLEVFQAVEEKKTVELGQENQREELAKVGRILYQKNEENKERTDKEAVQEAMEASKAMDEAQVAEKELENLYSDAEKVVEFISHLGESVQDQDFKDKLVPEMNAFQNITEKVEELSEFSEENIEKAEHVKEEAKKAAE